MSTQPVCTIRPPAKYTEDVSGFVPSLTASASTESTKSTLTPTLTDVVDSSPEPPSVSTLAKRPRARPLVLTIDEDTTDQDNAPKLKKAKKSQAQPAVTALQSEVSIIDIHDIHDTNTDRLNKSKPTADIKEFFVAMPRLPGQDKVRMLCTLCE